MTKQGNALQSITKGIHFLKQQQQADGSFLSLSSPDPTTFTKALSFHSVFSSALILSNLCSVQKTPQTQQIKRGLAKFLLMQKSKQWTWNYWTRTAEEYKTLPYPDDWDDSSCALAGLYLYDKTLVTSEGWAHIIRMLTYCEVGEGGPYTTWIVPKSIDPVWLDVDTAVTSNIAYLLSLQNLTLPNLLAHIEHAIEHQEYTTPYYPTPFPTIYFISRFYKGPYLSKLKSFLVSIQKIDGTWGNPLNTALALTSLLFMHTNPHEYTNAYLSLLLTQQPNGGWNPEVFYTGVNPKRDRHYVGGSRALTTSFCLQALSLYTNAIKSEDTHDQEEHFYNTVVTNMQKTFSLLPPDLLDQTQNIFTRIQQFNKDTYIFLLPYLFANSLNKKIDQKLLLQLCMATVYGWMAYTVYDDFFDGEGVAKKLPVAIYCLRELTTIYTQILPKNNSFHTLFQKTMNTLDNANTWELTHCRFFLNNNTIDLSHIPHPYTNNLSTLADKSAGHGLGPLAILFSLGYTKDSPEVIHTTDFFHHYLIAKQLNDDAHDVFMDLAQGQLTSVGQQLLQDYRTNHSNTSVSLDNRKIKKVFWEKTIDTICEQIFFHCEQAQQAVTNIPLIVDATLFSHLITKLKHAAQQALDERNNTQSFLQVYASF